MNSTFHSTKRIHIQVIKHLPLGLFVETDDHRQGLVRVREISWDEHKRQHWRTLYPLGWSGWAAPLAAKTGHHLEYSLRLVENDPWEDLSETLDLNQVYEGIVTGVVAYGAFIELTSGLTGLLHKSQLPAWVTTSPIELFWPGDRVRVRIRELNCETRRLSLGLPPLSSSPTSGAMSCVLVADALRKEKGTQLEEFLRSGLPPQHILLVEDEPEQQKAVANWLMHVGQRVETATSAEQALQMLEISPPHLVLIDVGLPGMSGTQLATHILERWPNVRVVIATDWARQESLASVLDTLRERGIALYPKPLLPEDLIDMLKNSSHQAPGLPVESEQNRPRELTTASQISNHTHSAIHRLLRQARRELGFDQAILFTFDPTHRAVTLYDRSGDGFLEKNALPALIYSPVRDVAEDGITLLMPSIEARDRDRFRYLLEWMPALASCIGVPVRSTLQAQFALFLFGERPRPITKEHRLYAEAIAQSISAVLEQQTFQQKAMMIQRTALIGHLTRAMTHEINNLLGPLAARLDTLQTRLAKLEQDARPEQIKAHREALLQTAFDDSRQIIQRIINTTRMFTRITSKGKNEVLRLDEIIEETIYLLRESENQSQVRFDFQPPKRMLVIRGQAAALEQILLNLLLNAIQQIKETRPGISGWVQVRFDEQINPSETGYFRILVEDNGPGIHARLWEKIFEAGYSTRRDGSGIGLYISRSLVEEMGGRLYVAESYILGGTSFALELPYQL
ncbi:MAG: hypothetical protein DDG60_16090 [Anaerolineae bacterium]|nr:MAG: hypothetical protein DDG60_16090 [Anaerolineae bacterium]